MRRCDIAAADGRQPPGSFIRPGLAVTRLAGVLGAWRQGENATLEATPLLADLLAYWQRLAADGPPPLYRIAPGAIPGWGFCAIVDLSDGVDHAWYRSSGAALTRLWGRDLEGLRLADCYRGGVWQDVRRAYTEVIQAAAPRFAVREFRLFNRAYGYRRLLLPLRDNQGRIAYVMTGLCPSDPALLDAHQWRPAAEESALLDQPGNEPHFD